MKSIDIKLNGKNYPFRLGMWAIAEFNDKTGKDFFEIVDLKKGFSLKDNIILFYYGFRDGARAKGTVFNLSIEQVSDLLEESGDIQGLFTELVLAIEKQMPQGGEPGKKKKT